jgi:hypothetical protein
MKTILNFNKSLIICLSAILIIATTACHKDGSGGKNSINGYVKHHDKVIPNATVYIKYGATEFPGTNVSNYDASVTADANAYYEIKDLYRGDYYLYGVGYDSNIGLPVSGGIAVKIKYNKKTTTINVPVTE